MLRLTDRMKDHHTKEEKKAVLNETLILLQKEDREKAIKLAEHNGKEKNKREEFFRMMALKWQNECSKKFLSPVSKKLDLSNREV